MITSQEAIDVAVKYLSGLPSELIGEIDNSRRLESVERRGDNWVVVLSYLSSSGGSNESAILDVLSRYRLYREIAVDTEEGEVLSMIDPTERRRVGS